jgi:hypothetical protein
MTLYKIIHDTILIKEDYTTLHMQRYATLYDTI